MLQECYSSAGYEASYAHFELKSHAQHWRSHDDCEMENKNKGIVPEVLIFTWVFFHIHLHSYPFMLNFIENKLYW